MIGIIVVSVNRSNRKRLKQGQKFVQIFMFPCTECISQRHIRLVINRPPQPYLVGLVMIITPHFVHFCRYRANFNINSRIVSPVSQVILVDLLCEFFRFFNAFVTVLGEIFRTRPISRVPLPFMVISTIFSFVPGRQALFLYSS